MKLNFAFALALLSAPVAFAAEPMPALIGYTLIHDPSVMWVVADRLGLPAGTWAPFSPPWYARLNYPSVHDVPRRSPAAAAA